MGKIDHGQDNWTIVKYCSSTAQSNFFLSPRIWPMWKNVFYWTIFISQEVEWHPTVTSQQQQRASLYRYGLSNIFIKVRTPNIWSFSVFLSISLNLNCICHKPVIALAVIDHSSLTWKEVSICYSTSFCVLQPDLPRCSRKTGLKNTQWRFNILIGESHYNGLNLVQLICIIDTGNWLLRNNIAALSSKLQYSTQILS